MNIKDIDWKNPESPWYAGPTNHRLVPGAWEYGTRYAFVRDRVEPGSKVLDVGCNCGQLAKNLQADLGCEVWGIDIVPEFVDRGRTMREARFLGPFVCGDFSRMGREEMEHLGLAGNHFDVVTALEVIEHPVDPGGFKDNLKRALKVGGLFVLTTPHPLNPDAIRWVRETNWHACLWDRGLLELWLGPLHDYTVLPDEDGTPAHIGAAWRWDGWNHPDVNVIEDVRSLVYGAEE